MKKFRVKKQGLPSEVFSTTAGEIGRAMSSGRSVSHLSYLFRLGLESFFNWATGSSIMRNILKWANVSDL